MLGLISGSWSWGMGGRLAPQLVCVEPQCNLVSQEAWVWLALGWARHIQERGSRQDRAGGGPEGHCSRATQGGWGLSGFQSQLSVCSSVWSTVLSGQASVARDLGSGWWHCHLPASGTAPGTSCPSRTLPLTGQGGLAVTLSPKSAIFGDTLAVRTGRQGVGRWGMVSGEYQPGCCCPVMSG